MECKAETDRKPILLRGAKQVGKTSAIKIFSSNLKYFLSVNFDELRDYVKVVETTNGIEDVFEQLSLITGTPIIAGETLIELNVIDNSSMPMIQINLF